MSAFSSASQFAYRENGETKVDENIANMVQPVEAEDAGEYVTLSMVDAIYDSESGFFSLAWNWNVDSRGETLYLLGENLNDCFSVPTSEINTYLNADEEILSRSFMPGELQGYVEAGHDEIECTLSFDILRITAEVVKLDEAKQGFTPDDEGEAARDKWIDEMNAQGKLVMNGINMILMPQAEGKSWHETLLESDKFELAQHVEVTFTLSGEANAPAKKRVVPITKKFDGYEIRIEEGEIGFMDARIVVNYISDEKPLVIDEKGMGNMWDIDFSAPGVGRAWHKGGGGRIQDPVLLEDGRWLNVYEYEASSLKFQPDELLFTLHTYTDRETRVEHTDDAFLVQFQ